MQFNQNQGTSRETQHETTKIKEVEIQILCLGKGKKED